MSFKLSLTLVIFSLLFVPVFCVQAQNSTPVLSGTVADPGGAAIPRAVVILLGGDGGELDRTLASGEGRFAFATDAAGPFRVRVELVGFAATELPATVGEPVIITLELAPVREQVVVTATRTDAPTSQLGATSSVFTEADIADRQAVTVSDLLRSMPGGAVVRSGGYGAITSLFVRGGESDHNKVLLDGVPLNEPGGTFFFNSLSLENIERVEIVRGPQSALFGSDAVAGVVQLFTRRGESETDRPRFFAAWEGGNRATWRGRGGLSGDVDRFDYSAQWGRFSTDNREINNFFHDTTLSANLGYALSQTTSLRAVVRGEFARAGTPNQTAFGPADLGAFTRRGEGAANIQLHNRTTSFWEQRLLYGFSQTRSRSRDIFIDPEFVPEFNGLTAEFSRFDFLSDFLSNNRRHHMSYQSDWRTGTIGNAAGQHQITFALDWEGERGFLGTGVNPRRDNFGWVFQHQALWSRFSLTTGVRIEDNDSFGTITTPRLSAAYFVRNGGGSLGATKFKFNFGLGFKEPSMFESFSTSPFALGNPDLRPERTRSFDTGVEQRFWYDRAKLELNLFHNRFKDLVGFETTDFSTFAGSFFNIGRAKAKGVETVLDLAPRAGLRARGSYTFLDSQVVEAGTVFDPVFSEGRPLLRRPKHSGAFELWWDWRQFTLNSTMLFVGRRADSDFAGLSLTSNQGYTRWDLGAGFRSPHGVTYFAAVENLLNDDYMEVLGFPALKLMFRIGARAEF